MCHERSVGWRNILARCCMGILIKCSELRKVLMNDDLRTCPAKRFGELLLIKLSPRRCVCHRLMFSRLKLIEMYALSQFWSLCVFFQFSHTMFKIFQASTISDVVLFFLSSISELVILALPRKKKHTHTFACGTEYFVESITEHVPQEVKLIEHVQRKVYEVPKNSQKTSDLSNLCLLFIRMVLSF